MTRTNIVLDDGLVAEALSLTGTTTKREVVDLALRELVKRQRQVRLKQLRGKELIDPDYDVAAMRRRMARYVD